MNPLDKTHSQTLASKILLALPREPITLLFEQESHIVESLLGITLHLSIDIFIIVIPLLPSVKVRKEQGALIEVTVGYRSIVAP